MPVRRALALSLVVPLLLAGCAEDEPEPKMPDPPETSSSSPSPTETETAEAESPEDFIRRWQQAGDEMQASGDTKAYRSITPKCKACTDLADNVDEIYSGGGSIEFTGSRIVSVKDVGDEPPTFEMSLRVPETTINRGDGQRQVLPAGSMRIRVTLGPADDGWVVNHYGIL